MDSDPILRKSAILTLAFVALLWGIKLWEWLADWPLVTLGVYPRSTQNLAGILFGPLIHGSFMHIATNTFSVLVLGTALLYGFPKSRWRVLATIWLLSGIGVWLFGRPAFHIGASGLTHGLFFFLLVASVLPSEQHVSFEYHLFGGAAGVLAALLFWRMDPKPAEKHYDWENEADDTPLDETSQR